MHCLGNRVVGPEANRGRKGIHESRQEGKGKEVLRRLWIRKLFVWRRSDGGDETDDIPRTVDNAWIKDLLIVERTKR